MKAPRKNGETEDTRRIERNFLCSFRKRKKKEIKKETKWWRVHGSYTNGDVVPAVGRNAEVRPGAKGRYPFSFLRRGEWMLRDTYRRGDANTNVRVRTSGIRRIACCTGRIAAASIATTTDTTTAAAAATTTIATDIIVNVRGCTRLFTPTTQPARCTRVDLRRFYCRRYCILRFTNAARAVVALGFSPARWNFVISAAGPKAGAASS